MCPLARVRQPISFENDNWASSPHYRMAPMLHVSSPSTAKLLVVDDEPDIVGFVQELLVARGYQVLGLTDSREVASHFDAFQPDVCILDFHMPHWTGSDLL